MVTEAAGRGANGRVVRIDDPASLFEDGERVLGEFKAREGALFRKADLVSVPLGILVMLLSANSLLLLVTAGVYGFWLAVWRLSQDWMVRDRLSYLVTDRRLLVLQGDRVAAWTFAELPPPGTKGREQVLDPAVRHGWARLGAEGFAVPSQRLDRLILLPNDLERLLVLARDAALARAGP
ncbi:MAG: hypothetical protein MUF14_10445 [Hyphomonadaceae bacterium]|jgi:hypothetical protein|nr:hypothetical protein [Hyphomonadaceae bacterium]